MSQASLPVLPHLPEPDDLERLRELAELGLVSASLIHELRQPIFALQSYLFLLQRQGDLGEGLAEQVRYLQSLVEFYDSYSPREVMPHRIDLCVELQSVEPVLARQARQHQIELRLALPEHPLCIRARPAGPRQVIANLVRNAIEASPPQEPASVDLGLSRCDSWVVLSVRDRGPGVPPQLAEQIFEPWFTTKGAEGTGLGLHLSRRILRADGGDLAVHTHATGGAVFEARWPVA